MKKIFVFIMLSLFLLGTYNNVFADYKIILKNGGKLIVKDYKKEGSSIRLYTTAGEMEIDQSNVENIKSVDIEEDANEPSAKPEKENITEEKTLDIEKNKKTETKNIQSPDNIPDDLAIKTKTVENEIKGLEKKNAELKSEEKQLQEESKKIEEDLKKEGKIMPVRKKREFDKRTSELDKKVESHNQKVKQYNQEQDNLLK